jgi:hypothetical protein
MNRRYQVFLSSTYDDLKEERLEVIKALLELDCIPCGMEYFPAASEESWSYIKSLIDDCDYYVVIIGGRYGSLTQDGIGFTQKEYEYAISKGVPTIAFLHAAPNELPVKDTEQTDEGRKKLAGFIKTIETKLCKKWRNADELGAVVSRSLTQLIKRMPRTGWVKSDSLAGSQATKEILTLTKKVKELETELAVLKTEEPKGIENLAKDSDKVQVNFSYSVKDPKRKYGDQTVGKYEDFVNLTWNDLFFKISPLIAGTSSTSGVRSALSRLIINKWDVENEEKEKGHRIGKPTVTEDSLQTIKIQFLALGYIEIGKGKKNEYDHSLTELWSLKKLGEKKMFALRAIKKSSKK